MYGYFWFYEEDYSEESLKKAYYNKPHGNVGKKMPPQTKLALSKKLKGKTLSEEHKKKIKKPTRTVQRCDGVIYRRQNATVMPCQTC